MNIRNVLRTYSLLRQLTDDESALLETLRNATDAEREMLVETLAPQKSTTKRAGKKPASKSASKSSRASGMAAAINRSLSQGRQADIVEGGCVAKIEGRLGKTVCSEPASSLIHDPNGGYKSYHKFDAGKLPAPRAGAESSTNGGATSSTASSGTGKEDVSNAVHAGG